jgi:hypothetical protein
MGKNRNAKMIFRSAYCALGILAVFASLGIFENVYNIRWDFYIYFTNLSNYLCLGVMIAELVACVKQRDEAYTSECPKLKFIGLVAILLTFLVFNLILAWEEGRDPVRNFEIGSVLLHVILPIMYIADWLLFDERGMLKWRDAFLTILFPLCYFIFIIVQAAILGFDTSIKNALGNTPLIYPYFFLDFEKQQVGGVAKWLLIIVCAIVVLSVALILMDRLLNKKRKNN